MKDREGISVENQADVGRLFEQYRGRLLQVVHRRIDPALAARIDPEEVLQEAFLVACRRWDRRSLEPDFNPFAWLYRIVLDSLIELWRHESREIRDHRRDLPWPADSSVQLALHLADDGTSPISALAREELLNHVKQVVNDLGANDHEILWMRHYDQLSFKEAAAVLGVSQNAATVRYARALQRLRSKWHNETGESES